MERGARRRAPRAAPPPQRRKLETDSRRRGRRRAPNRATCGARANSGSGGTSTVRLYHVTIFHIRVEGYRIARSTGLEAARTFDPSAAVRADSESFRAPNRQGTKAFLIIAVWLMPAARSRN